MTKVENLVVYKCGKLLVWLLYQPCEKRAPQSQCGKKATYKQAIEDCNLAAGRKPKQLKQTLLLFVPCKPTIVQVRNRINAGIHPSIAACIENLPPECIISVHDAEKNKGNEVSCNGILAKKDLINVKNQRGITYLLQYTVVGDEEQSGYKYRFIEGMSNIHLLFCVECPGDSDTVR